MSQREAPLDRLNGPELIALSIHLDWLGSIRLPLPRPEPID